MDNIRQVLESIVPISRFNRGEAGKVFEEVRQSGGAKVVIKNNVPECVLISPEAYTDLLDRLEDHALLELASSRLDKADSSALIAAEEVNSNLGITDDDLADYDEVEIE